MSQLRTALIAIAAAVFFLTQPAASRAQDENDHLQCYKIKDTVGIVAQVDLDPPLVMPYPDCKVQKAKLFCTPSSKSVDSLFVSGMETMPLPVSGPDPGDRICYALKCPDRPLIPDTVVTDQFAQRPLSHFKTAMLCTPAITGVYQRFVDNGDGTVTDNETGLQWEKKTGTYGSGTTLLDPHDVDNIYDWSISANCTISDCQSGTLFKEFLYLLNNCSSNDGTAETTGGFAGHCDWRVPTVQELKTIVDNTAPGCGASPCIPAIFGPTAPNYYWTNTETFTFTQAWIVSFHNFGVFSSIKNGSFSARAVRKAR